MRSNHKFFLWVAILLMQLWAVGSVEARKQIDHRQLNRAISALDDGISEVRHELGQLRRALKNPRLVVWMSDDGWRAAPRKEIARRVRILMVLLPGFGAGDRNVRTLTSLSKIQLLQKFRLPAALLSYTERAPRAPGQHVINLILNKWQKFERNRLIKEEAS